MELRHAIGAVLLLKQGIEQALGQYRSFAALEEEVGRLVRESAAWLLAGALESMDEALLAREGEGLEVEGIRTRSLLSVFGPLEVRRRMYKEKGTGRRRFLLDEALGLEERTRVTPGLREIGVKLGVEMPFRRAAEVMAKLVPGVSAMTVWKACKEAGEKAKADAEEVRERVFERGENPGGKRKVEVLHIEADGLVVGLQRSRSRRGELKLGVAYEGKEAKGKRVELKERRKQ